MYWLQEIDDAKYFGKFFPKLKYSIFQMSTNNTISSCL